MDKFSLKFKPKVTGDGHYPARAWIILGDHSIDEGHDLLTPECVTVAELESAVESIKKQLDQAVAKARIKFRRE